jgi:hypothetical protein
MLLHIQFHSVIELDAGIGELTGERQDDADLDGLLGVRWDADKRQETEAKGECAQHGRSLVLFGFGCAGAYGRRDGTVNRASSVIVVSA